MRLSLDNIFIDLVESIENDNDAETDSLKMH